MKFQKQTFRASFFLFLLICLLSGLVGVVQVPVSAAPRMAIALDVVINEIAWAGTSSTTIADEWIELYNPTASNIDLTGWTLIATSGTPNNITLAGIIPTNGYFLLERTDDTATSVTADQFFIGAIANNSGGDSFTLRDQLNNIIDTANINGGSWPGGTAATGSPTYASMERISIGIDSDSNWGSNNGITRNGTDAGSNPINGTPKQQNSIFALPTATPTITNTPTNTSTPTITFTPSLTPIASLTPTLTPVPAEVVISEVAWSGTTASANDEWIELYNTRNTALSLTNWRLVNSTGSVDVVLNGSIPAKGFFLLERALDFTVSDAAADQIYFGALGDANDSLTLSLPNGTIVDTANKDLGAWPAGTGSPGFNSMERVVKNGVPVADTASGWISNTQASTWTKHDARGTSSTSYLIHGTPAGDNWGFTVTATVLPPPTNTPTRTSTPGLCGINATPTSLIINEVAWMGTAASATDEWIELYNPTSSLINLNGWILRAVDGTPIISLANKDLPAGQYYLLERTADTTVSDVTANQIYTGELGNSSEALQLYNPFGVCVDTANSNGGAWPAGQDSSPFGTMERRGVIPDSDTAWITNVNSATWTKHDSRGTSSTSYLIHGTPGYANWAFSVTATPSPQPTKTPRRTATPTRVFIPAPPPPLIGINEFVPRPGHDWNLDGVINVGDEYIELLNHGVIDVNLGGYTLDDEVNVGSPPYRLPSVVLKPGQRMVFYGTETGLLLGDGGDGVRLLKPNGQLGDAYNYTVVKFPDQSYCRLPDNGGLDDWNQNCFPTPGLQNSLSGTFVRPPTETNADEPLCPIADILPFDFTWAECPSFGNIWSRFYWDQNGWFGEKVIPRNNSKWDVYVD